MVQASIFRLLDNLEWILPWLIWFLVADLVERAAGKAWKDRRCRYLDPSRNKPGYNQLTFT